MRLKFAQALLLCQQRIFVYRKYWKVCRNLKYNKQTNSYLDWSPARIPEFRVDPVSQVFPGWESPL